MCSSDLGHDEKTFPALIRAAFAVESLFFVLLAGLLLRGSGKLSFYFCHETVAVHFSEGIPIVSEFLVENVSEAIIGIFGSRFSFHIYSS